MNLSRYSFSTLLLFQKAVFCEVTPHGMFTFNATPFNSVYFLSVLTIHMYKVEETDCTDNFTHGLDNQTDCVDIFR